MICNLSKLSKFAVFVFYTFFILQKNVNAIDQLDLILCGRKGNQYYVTSTPFITQGAYLYADLLIKAIDGPWPVKKDDVAYTLDEFKLEIVRKVILTSPARLRLQISNVMPPENSAWIEIMGRMNKYPKSLRIINDIRFSVFLCGPDMLDSPVLTKFIEKINRRYGYNFNPFSDKVIVAALKMHGVLESTIKRKQTLSERKHPRNKTQEKEKSKIQKEFNKISSPPLVEFSSEPTRLEEKLLSSEEKPVITQKPSLILNESEFEEFKDERFFESDYSKTPPYPEGEQKQSSVSNPVDLSDVSSELPETTLVTTGTSTRPQFSSVMPNFSDIRVSHINKNGKYSLNLNPETSVSTEDYQALKNETLLSIESKHEQNEDIEDIDVLSRINEDEEIKIQSLPSSQTETQNFVTSPKFENSNIQEPEIQVKDDKMPNSASEDRILEYNSKGTIGPPPDHKPLEILIPPHEYTEDNTELKEDARNYREQDEIANRIEADLENEDSFEDDEDFEEEYNDEYEFASEDEYNQYLDYKDHHLRNKKGEYGEKLDQRETNILSAKYPLGKNLKSQKALLQDISSVFTDLLNAVKANKISEKNIAFGIPTINLKLNTRSKAIVFGDRIIKKWKAQNIDGVLKSIPIFHQGSFDELSTPTKEHSLASNFTKKESTYIELDFNSAIRSHDQNEGGYVWMQRNLIATRTTSGFQDVLIKAALKGLETLSSIQCSSILSMPISSKEVEECISAYFGSIFFGQNKVYGAITENDEENSIRGFEVSQAFKPPQEETVMKEQKLVSEEFDEADFLIRKHLKQSSGTQKEEMSEDESSNLDLNDELIRRNLKLTPGSAIPETLANKTSKDYMTKVFSKEKKSQFSENSEDFSDEFSEESSGHPPAITNTTIAEDILTKSKDVDLNKGKKLQMSKTHSILLPKNKTKDINMSEYFEMEDYQNLQEERKPHSTAKIDNEAQRIPDEYKDPEFIEKSLEKLAMNITETYRKVSDDFKVPTTDLETITSSYNEFLDQVELWSAIAGEALIFTGKKMKGLLVSKSNKLSYFYSREEFYVYQAILNYSSNLIASLNSFYNLKKNLEETRELLRKSFSTILSYKSIQDLSRRFNDNLEQFKNTYGNNVRVFCSGLTIGECLGTMKDDFYRRNEKFSNFIARNGSLKKAVSQILELFDIKVSTKDYLSIHGGSRDDVNRYLAIKGYLSNQAPIFTKKFNKKLLKEQLNIDRIHATAVIKELLDKQNLNSRTLSCGEIRWEPKNKSPKHITKKSKI
ncbi:uncharacterized protein ELE39_000836 [Cryptosporidium sp. chipmunk genotype I]|uniref:uncharacterized protein n=1 Tax=Cryptosporidium sp. chipmunk genotype I TaxID=1280935 RepID=UPI00351A6D52|nr:hypothetical protein ELE39_000836 [Cryptosporidium sp. chipmunk genotype I]